MRLGFLTSSMRAVWSAQVFVLEMIIVIIFFVNVSIMNLCVMLFSPVSCHLLLKPQRPVPKHPHLYLRSLYP